MCKKIKKIFAIFSLEEVLLALWFIGKKCMSAKNKHFGLENKFSRKTLAYVAYFLYLCAFFLQSKREMIKHDGIIIALNEDGTALVRIVQTSACAACKAKAMCASAESVEKEMTVVLLGENGKVKTENNSTQSYTTLHDSTQSYHVGDTVEVMVQQKMGWKAVVLAYLLPFFVMLAVIFTGNALWNVREEILGTAALCAMALYYIVLGLFKDKLQKEFSFTAKKKNN